MPIDLGILILRVVVGAVMFGHGAQKLFGWWGGPGLTGAAGFFGSHLRMRPAFFWAALGSFTEVAGGLLLALGFLGPLAPVAVVAAMAMAVSAHWPKFWAQQGGIEYPLVLLVAGLSLGITGSGAYSLDAALGLQLLTPVTLIGGLIAAVIGVFVALATRAPAPATELSGQGAVAHS
jgi:putative oxidoreductase